MLQKLHITGGGLSDSWRGNNVLDVSDFKHYRIYHSETFADAKKSYQRDREFLEPGEATFAQV